MNNVCVFVHQQLVNSVGQSACGMHFIPSPNGSAACHVLAALQLLSVRGDKIVPSAHQYQKR